MSDRLGGLSYVPVVTRGDRERFTTDEDKVMFDALQARGLHPRVEYIGGGQDANVIRDDAHWFIWVTWDGDTTYLACAYDDRLENDEGITIAIGEATEVAHRTSIYVTVMRYSQ